MTKVKAGITIAVNIAGVIASATVMAATSVTVAGAIAGGISVLRSTMAVLKQIETLSKTAKEAYDEIKQKRDRLDKDLDRKELAANTLKELGKETLNKVLVIEIAGITETVSGLETDFKILRTKLIGLKREVIKLRQSIVDVTDTTTQSTLERQMKQVKDQLKQMGESPEARDARRKQDQLETQLQAFEESTQTLIDKNEKMTDLVANIEAFVDRQGQVVGELKSRFSAKTVTYGAIAADFVIAAASFIAGDWTKPHQVLKELDEHAKRAGEIVKLTHGSLETGADIALSLKELGEHMKKDLGV
jgi:phage shock protein A